MAPADERKINRNEALVRFRKVNSISLRVHRAVQKTVGRWHDMALTMSYVELGIDQEGKSPRLLGWAQAANLWLYGGGQAGGGTDAENLGKLGSGHPGSGGGPGRRRPSPAGRENALPMARDAGEQCVCMCFDFCAALDKQNILIITQRNCH